MTLRIVRRGLADALRRQADRQERRFAQSLPGSSLGAFHDLDCAVAVLFRAIAARIEEER